MNTKKIITRFLLAFIIFSIAVLGYKEFVRGDHKKAVRNTKVQSENISAEQESVDNRTSQMISPTPKSEASPVQAAVQPARSKVIAYYFHGKFRCTTCRAIEQYSHDAIHTYFAKELENGKLQFRPVNVEEPENRHFVQDYQLFSKSLVLSLVADGKEIKWKNLTDVWKLVSDKERFFQYVKDETEQFLKEKG